MIYRQRHFLTRLRQSLAAVKAKTPDDALVDANNEASSDTLAECLGEFKAKKVGKT